MAEISILRAIKSFTQALAAEGIDMPPDLCNIWLNELLTVKVLDTF